MQNSCEFIFVVPQRGVRTNPSNPPPPYTLDYIPLTLVNRNHIQIERHVAIAIVRWYTAATSPETDSTLSPETHSTLYSLVYVHSTDLYGSLHSFHRNALHSFPLGLNSLHSFPIIALDSFPLCLRGKSGVSFWGGGRCVPPYYYATI